VWEAVTRAQLIYGSETWYISEGDAKRISAFETRWLRRITGMLPKFSNTTKVRYPRNEDVRICAGYPAMVHLMDRQRLRFIGHVIRRGADDSVKRMFLDKMPLTGRPGFNVRNSVQAQLRRLMTAAMVTPELAKNRYEYRRACDEWLISKAPWIAERFDEDPRLVLRRIGLEDGEGPFAVDAETCSRRSFVTHIPAIA
jgi:hypothetical protein